MKHAIGFAAVGVMLSGVAMAAQSQVEEVSFESRGATLSGSIVWPAQSPPVAAVVFVHGSGPQARDLGRARRFAALRAGGRRFDEQVYPDLGHNNLAATFDAAIAWLKQSSQSGH